MGCGINGKKNVLITSKTSDLTLRDTLSSCIPNKQSFISDDNWLKIFHFLSFTELKEVGRTNKYFNRLSRDDKLFIKFFRNNNYIYNQTYIQSFCFSCANTTQTEPTNSVYYNKGEFLLNVKVPSFGDYHRQIMVN